jgi:general secretion pathway protein E/type IV pilus assembly protein PilB
MGLEQSAVLVLDEIVRRAVRAKASDVHLEPKRDRLQVRFRIDGEMVEEQSVPIEIALEVISRIKVLARMDIAERRVPQDGQLTLTPFREIVHFRASTFPSSLGEKMVLRLLGGQSIIAFDMLGLEPDTAATMRLLIDRPQGFIVASGPTGAGKTSTLYACLNLLDTKRTNIITLEDPIEIEMASITQGQTNVKAGFTFATGLRAILRQDPDVIMVGEIRDAETAGIALQASLTGHQVFSTLHTNDAVDSVVRLVDLGVEPWVVGNALTAILSQRLVRRACPNCSETYIMQDAIYENEEIAIEEGTSLIRTHGCDKCMNTGYRGRTGIFEVIIVDDDMRELIKKKASPREYRQLLKRRNIGSLRRVGLERAKQKITTIDEVLRVTT